MRSYCILLVLSHQQTPDNAGNKQDRDNQQGQRVQTVEQNCQIEGDQGGCNIGPDSVEQQSAQESQSDAEYQHHNIRTISGNCPRYQGEKYLQTQSPVQRRIRYLLVYRPLCDEVLENLGSYNSQQNQESNLKNDAQGIGLRVINDQTGDEEAERRGADDRQVLRLGDRHERQSA